MMLGVSALMGGTSADAAAAAAESGGASGGSSEVGASSSVPAEEINDRSGGGGGGGGNRWPRQETIALLKIRSDMGVVFRDSSLKGPLWEEVSRKMAELGFQRSAKKCKEKFENVYKYHKRTKDGRATKSDGKTYRFFDQLEALEAAPPPPPPQPFTPPPPRPHPPSASAMPPLKPAPPMQQPSHIITTATVSSTSPTPLTAIPPIQTSNNNPINPAAANASNPPPSTSFPHFGGSLRSDSTSGSSTSSDEDLERRRRRGKKRKWKDFFQRLMRDVIHKQEDLQRKFLDTLEKRERDRVAREEAWRLQEMTRLNREHDFLVQERSITAAKDAAVIAFLQKVTDQDNLHLPIPTTTTTTTTTPMHPPQQPPPPPPPPPHNPPPPPPKPVTPALPPPAAKAADDGGDNSAAAGSSRWPKAEVQALINLRTSLDMKYQENGPKGPLWEEISSAMIKLGYNRSSKRCKEKWENINKYFKKVKESSKKRPEDSKTCPYFHQLDAIYKERAKNDVIVPFNQGYAVNSEPIMARPEQQWPLPDQKADDQDRESENNDHDEDEDEDDEEGGDYEMVTTNKQTPSTAAE